MYFWNPLYGRAANFAAWLDDLKAINGFDEAMVGYGSEDVDVFQRLYNLGRKRNYAKCMAVCYHLYHPRPKLVQANHEQYVRNAGQVRCDKGLVSQ